MGSTYRILLYFTILIVLVFNIQDEKNIKNNSIYNLESSSLDHSQINHFKERIRLGLKKQSIMLLDQHAGEQREL